jgi:uncharacterized protein YabE (DUF348 family)
VILLPLAKNIRRYVSLKAVTIVLFAVVISVLIGIGYLSQYQKEVVIDCDGKLMTVKTMKSTVKEVLEQRGIKVNEYDIVSQPLDTQLKRDETNKINIKLAVPVIVVEDDREIELMTCKETIGEALKGDPVNLGPRDRIEGADPSDKVVKDMNIRIVRVRQEMVSQNEIVPFEVVRTENTRMVRGEERVLNEGKDGVREKVFSVTYEDKREIDRQLIKERVIYEPEKRLVEYGTSLGYTTSRGESFAYKKVLNMRATAYTASFKDTGKSPGHPEFGITYTGIKVKRGIIAVDPKVIPLGTRVYVEGVGDVPDYGYALAADIGSAIKGDLIDLYMDGQDVVDRWGVKKVKVYILSE